MSILAFLTDPPVVSAILLHLDLPHTPPPLSPARGPPQGDLLFDQTPAFDPTDAEPDLASSISPCPPASTTEPDSSLPQRAPRRVTRRPSRHRGDPLRHLLPFRPPLSTSHILLHTYSAALAARSPAAYHAFKPDRAVKRKRPAYPGYAS